MSSLLVEMGRLEHGLRIAAVTRFPQLVPDGIEPVPLAAESQLPRMALSLPRLLGRLRPDLAHFLHALPLRCPCPAVVTIQDLSFAVEPSLMPGLEGALFRFAVPRSARRSVRVLTGSERTRRDLVRLYGLPERKVAVIPYGVDAAFSPGRAPSRAFVLFVGAVQPRKDPLAAATAAAAAGLPLVVAGPVKSEELAAELVRRGARLLGYVSRRELVELYRDAACLVFPSQFEGFGLPVLEAMACGTPVVCADEPALREVGGAAAVYVPAGRHAEGVERAIAHREWLVEAGLARARLFSWEETARRTVAVYREALGLA